MRRRITNGEGVTAELFQGSGIFGLGHRSPEVPGSLGECDNGTFGRCHDCARD